MTGRSHLLNSLLLLAIACGPGVAEQPKQPAPEAVAKLVGQLGDDEFQTRQKASAELEKLGVAVLPALREALKSVTDAEAKRRLVRVLGRIEESAVQAEEKLYKELDAPRSGVADRLARSLTRTPALDDRQAATAVYLLTLGRSPTEQEHKDAQKQFAEGAIRWGNVLKLARPLAQGKEFNAELAGVHERLLEERATLAAQKDFTKVIERFNSADGRKLIDDAAKAAAKAKTDEDYVDLVFLMALSRFPEGKERKTALEHVKKAPDRAAVTADLFWALMNTKEYLRGKAEGGK